MANNNEKMTVVKTSLIALTKWGKEKKDNKRIDMGYFNDMLYFSVLKQNNEKYGAAGICNGGGGGSALVVERL